MKRRHFLQYSALATTSLTFASCSKDVKKANPVAFGKPEKADINLGFVATIECLPLIVAKNKGFFKDQGLNVTLVKFPTWDALKEALDKGKVDVAATHFATPLWSQVAKEKQPLIALMGLNINGGSIGLSKKNWDDGLRPSPKFNYRQEFSDFYGNYIRSAKEPLVFGIDHPQAMSSYLARYWLGSMQMSPDRQFKLQPVSDKDLLSGVQSGKIQAYAVKESLAQKLNKEKQGFTAYVNRDIWRGHPDKVLTTSAAWAKQNPIATKAVIASVLAACQFCDIERLRKEEEKTPITLAKELVQSDYLADGDAAAIKSLLTGQYQYDYIDKKPSKLAMNDFTVFHFVDNTNYLGNSNHANYIWQSHGTWLLTQMVRWHQLNLSAYPKNGDDLVKAAYGLAAYREVAKAVGVALPGEAVRKEAASAFIDKLAFDPSLPVDYLNGFDIRTS
jgi:nitrate/nitrite transport system substrate-binding protein